MQKIDFKELKETVKTELSIIKTQDELESFRLKYFSRKSGILNNILKSLKDLPKEEKKNMEFFQTS